MLRQVPRAPYIRIFTLFRSQLANFVCQGLPSLARCGRILTFVQFSRSMFLGDFMTGTTVPELKDVEPARSPGTSRTPLVLPRFF